MCCFTAFGAKKFGHLLHLSSRFVFKRQLVAKCKCLTTVVAFFRKIMSRPHFCNCCKNHGTMTCISHGHAKNCPWREYVCTLCMRARSRNLYWRSLKKRSDEPAGQRLASTSVTTVLSAANAIPPARTPTSFAPARAGRCPYFVVKMLHWVVSLFLDMFTVNSFKNNFPDIYALNQRGVLSQ